MDTILFDLLPQEIISIIIYKLDYLSVGNLTSSYGELTSQEAISLRLLRRITQSETKFRSQYKRDYTKIFGVINYYLNTKTYSNKWEKNYNKIKSVFTRNTIVVRRTKNHFMHLTPKRVKLNQLIDSEIHYDDIPKILYKSALYIKFPEIYSKIKDFPQGLGQMYILLMKSYNYNEWTFDTEDYYFFVKHLQEMENGKIYMDILKNDIMVSTELQIMGIFDQNMNVKLLLF